MSPANHRSCAHADAFAGDAQMKSNAPIITGLLVGRFLPSALLFTSLERLADGRVGDRPGGPEPAGRSFPVASVRASKRHWCFKAASREHVHAFFDAGVAAGGQSDGEPGLRPHYHAHYYAAFLVDPAGNRIEAVCNAAAPTPERA